MKTEELSLWEIRIHKEAQISIPVEDRIIGVEYIIGVVKDSNMKPTFHTKTAYQIKIDADGDHSGIYVGSEWMKKHLTEKEFADYIRWRMEGGNVGD